jgi:hypothetical protein
MLLTVMSKLNSTRIRRNSMEHKYELKVPFKYAHKDGDAHDAIFISMVAPNYKQIDKVAPIEQAMMGALNEAGSRSTATVKKEEIDDTAITGPEALSSMRLWSGNLAVFYKQCEKLFESGVAKIDGETLFTKALFEKMDPKDYYGLVGAYLANFTIPSLLDGL